MGQLCFCTLYAQTGVFPQCARVQFLNPKSMNTLSSLAWSQEAGGTGRRGGGGSGGGGPNFRGPHFRHRQEARGLLRQQLLPGLPEGKKVLQNLPSQSIFHQLSQLGGILSLRFKPRSTSGFSSFNNGGRGHSHWS